VSGDSVEMYTHVGKDRTGLAEQFTAEWSCNLATWHNLLEQFQDRSIFQTPAFGFSGLPRGEVVQMVLRRGGESVALAQARVISVPFLKKKLAQVRWGPVWERHGEKSDLLVFQEAIKALRVELVTRRRMVLRILPMIPRQEAAKFDPIFLREHYTRCGSREPERTMVLNLERSVDELRKGLDQKWRNQLKRAEGNGLEIIEGEDAVLLDRFADVYNEMLNRKRIPEPGDIRRFRQMQEDLPSGWRMRTFLCYQNGRIAAGAICSNIGKRGIYLFGGTGDNGLENKASYLIHWRVVQWLKECGCTRYDLHGVNQQINPGVYRFKAGLCGRNGQEIELLGRFDAYNHRAERWLLSVAEMGKQILHRCGSFWQPGQNPAGKHVFPVGAREKGAGSE
jgi:hypothetical protein